MIDIFNTIAPSFEQWMIVARAVQEMTGVSGDADTLKVLAAGGGHAAKFMRMLTVYATFDAPLSFWGQIECCKKSPFVCLSRSGTRRTIMTDYRRLAKICQDRSRVSCNWRDIREWIKSLPHSELITGENADDKGTDNDSNSGG